MVIPFPLFVIDQALGAVEDLIWVVERLWPGIKKYLHRQYGRAAGLGPGIVPSQGIGWCREIIAELRRYGRWRLVAVETGRPRDTRVYIDLY